MKTSDFYYDLPKELIAQDPLEDRSSSRLLHLSMKDGSMEHRHFTRHSQISFSRRFKSRISISAPVSSLCP